MRFVYSLVWRTTPGMIVWQSIVSLLQVFESFLFNVVFIKLIVQFLEMQYDVIHIVVLALVAILLKFSIAIINSIYLSKIKAIYAIRLSKYINMLLFKKALSLDLEQYEKKEFFDKYYKAMSQAYKKIEAVLTNSIQLMGNTLAAIIMVVYVVKIDPMLSLLIVVPLITSAAIKYMNKAQYILSMENMSLDREMGYINRVVYMKDYALELRLTDIFLCLKEKYLTASIKVQDNYKRYGKRLTFLRFISEYILTTLTILFSYLYIGRRYIYQQDIALGDFAVLVSAVSNMNFKVSSLLKNIFALQESGMYIRNIQDYLNIVPSIDKNTDGVTIDNNKEFYIKFDNVGFRYIESDVWALRNINIKISKGQKIAIVGSNGSGKSTFIKLLLRLYDVDIGNISINGIEINSLNLDAYRNMFAPVFQDYRLFAVSLMDNITMGTTTDKDRINEALHNVGLSDFVNSLDRGINSVFSKEIDEKGIVFSGGQSQKLALSRGFASNAEIIIFDEPSASLDPISEHTLFENIYNALRDKTVLFVSHRLTSTIRADKIIMFDKGEIVECGTHRELMEKKGAYYRMFNIQADAYREDGTCRV